MWETQALDEILDPRAPCYDSIAIVVRRGGWSQTLCCRLEVKPSATNYEWKTRQETRETGGRAEKGLMGTKFMLKILGGSQATGLWLGASPNREPHFHMQVSLWHVYSQSLGKHSFTRKAQPLKLWEGSSRGLWEVVGCMPLAGRTRFPSESITGHTAPDVRSGSRPRAPRDV